MSWIQKLYDTYEKCADAPLLKEQEPPLLPVSHTTQQAHVHITLDANGNFLRAKELEERKRIILPATEKSLTGRTSGPAPHPLADKIQYCAKDYERFCEDDKCYFDLYEKQLSIWCESTNAHPKAKAVLAYVRKGTLIQDLIKDQILVSQENRPRLIQLSVDLKDIFICWSVEVPGQPHSATWDDNELWEAWIRFDVASRAESTPGLCYVSGTNQQLSLKHPSRIRNARDGAKIISSNDSRGFTFRGRFTDAEGIQACGVGYEVSQKAHSALRWLISRQGFRNGSQQVFVSWAVSGKRVPPPLVESSEWMEEASTAFPEEDSDAGGMSVDHSRDVGQSFAERLNRYMAGYRANIDPTEDIVVMGLNSATPGRMSITYYRELQGSEFLKRLENWHSTMAWPQRLTVEDKPKGKGEAGKHVPWQVCAPGPRRIAETAYGRGLDHEFKRTDDKLKRATVERLLPCIIDGRELPRDLMDSCVRRAVTHPGLAAKRGDRKHSEWEQALGVACAMFRGYHSRHGNPARRRNYEMALEKEKGTRDYLYGRLLAIAERIEEIALNVAGESRPTTAARLMQRFADHPCSTWRTIELALQPYVQRLQSKRGGFLHNMKTLLDEVMGLFKDGDFQSDRSLCGEFLLGYHLQRLEWKKEKDNTIETEGEEK